MAAWERRVPPGQRVLYGHGRPARKAVAAWERGRPARNTPEAWAFRASRPLAIQGLRLP